MGQLFEHDPEVMQRFKLTEERYDDWQMAMEVIVGNEDNNPVTMLADIKKYYNEFPGPKGWEMPTDGEILYWIFTALENINGQQTI